MTQPIDWLTTPPPNTAAADQLDTAAKDTQRTVVEYAEMLGDLRTITVDSTQPLIGPVDDRLTDWISATRTAGCDHVTNPRHVTGLLLQPGKVWCWDCIGSSRVIIDQALDHPTCWGCDQFTPDSTALLITHGPIVIQALICTDCVDELP